MKYFDIVKVVVDKKEYRDLEIYEEMCGEITCPEIQDNCFLVHFTIPKNLWAWINVADLIVVEDGEESDDVILNQLPNKNPVTWCKVEDGYIINLLGEKKNKIAYDYNS
ncbi:MAG: hypothetical protein IJX26_03800 [Clostridia bacterium]|nr:hypothetical protein [Clostridia bacterium]